MKIETMLAKAKSESTEFERYAEYMLEEEPTLTLPMLRDLFKHNASASEYRAHLESIRASGQASLVEQKI